MDRVRRELDIVDPVPILYCTDFRILALAVVKVHVSINRKQSSKEEKRPHPFLEVCVIQLRKILERHWEGRWNEVVLCGVHPVDLHDSESYVILFAFSKIM